MKIYVGRWDLLPSEWEGYNGLVEKDEEDIVAELSREVEDDVEDNMMGVYNPEEFEETFNQQLNSQLRITNYWIRIFE